MRIMLNMAELDSGRGAGLLPDAGRLLLLLLGRRPRLRGRLSLQRQRTHGNTPHCQQWC